MKFYTSFFDKQFAYLLQKTLRIMKITFVLVFAALMQVYAISKAQNVTLSENNVSLDKVFKDIKQQTGINFLYNPEMLSLAKPVTIVVKNKPLSEVLDACFLDQPVTYTLYQNDIIVKAKPLINANKIITLSNNANIDVHGTVVDEIGKPLPGATIVVKGTHHSTTTDAMGFFTLKNVNPPVTLVVSFIGYNPSEVAVSDNGNPVLKIQLTPSKQELNEVTILGTYGNNKKVDNILGTNTIVSGDQTQDKPNASVLDALQGRVPGLSILSGSGEPGSLPSVRLQGLGSLVSGTDPLYILDGIEVSSGTILTINPDDIKETNVLRDAASTSIYGSRAANGVIVITTKQGSFNQAPSITVSSQYGVSNLASTSFFNAFMDATQWKSFEVSSGIMSQSQLNNILAGLPVQNANTQWYKYFYKSNQPMYQENINISGGGGKTSYFVSGGYLNQEGIAYQSQYERYTLRSNVTSKVNKWLQVGVNIGLEYDQRQSNPEVGAYIDGGLSSLLAPIYSLFDANGNRLNKIPGTSEYDPRYLAQQNPGITNNIQLDPTAYLLITPYKGLSIKTQGGVDASDLTASAIQLPSYIANPGNGNINQSFTRDVSKTFTNTIEYKFNVANVNHFDLLGGQEYQDETTSAFNGYGSGLSDDRLLLLNDAPNKVAIGSSEYEYAFDSFFGRAEYDWNDKYYAEASIRSDRSSRFGADHREGTFWSGGVSWDAKKEDFLKDVSWIDRLIIKANTGTQGNAEINGVGNGEIQDYESLALLSGTSFYNGVGGYSITQPGDPYLTWEQQQLTTFGVDVSFLDRIRLNASYYIRNTSNMLLSVPYPYTSGFASVTQNTGSLENKGINIGFEADAWKDPAHKGYVTLFVNADITHNKVTALFDGRQDFPQPNYLQAWVVGQPVTFYLPLYAGVNKQTGAPEWYLPGPNPSITNKNPNEVTSNYDQNALQQNSGIGQYAPFTGGFGFRAGYQGFTIETLFNFNLGKHLLSNDGYFYQNPNVFPGYNTLKVAANYWKAPGDNAQFPDINNYQMQQFDSSLLENASFMRLKDLNIGYSLPKSVTGDSKAFKSIKVFVEGRNLFTVTKYFGPDPEADTNLVYGQYPNTKQYTVGVKATL
jgi:TonB-linked SusC/RagA family outer membrane protein